MPWALSAEQVDQVVHNTLLVLLARPDLLEEWHDNLHALLRQVQEAGLEDETYFLGAVLTLLHAPGDRLPTGTSYDPTWQTLVGGLRPGAVEAAQRSQAVTIEQLLQSVAEAALAVLTGVPEQRDAVAREVRGVREAAAEGGTDELVAWLDGVLALLDGMPPDEVEGTAHAGVYGTYWRALVDRLTSSHDERPELPA